MTSFIEYDGRNPINLDHVSDFGSSSDEAIDGKYVITFNMRGRDELRTVRWLFENKRERDNIYSQLREMFVRTLHMSLKHN